MHSILGYDPNSLLDRSILELAPDNPAGEAWNALANCFEMRDSGIEVLHKNGDRIPMSASATAIWSDTGSLSCSLISFHSPSSGALPWGNLQEDQADYHNLAYEISVAESRERERIARGLHDVVGQLHTLLSIKLDELKEASLTANTSGLLSEMRTLLNQATQATRATTFDLSNPLINLLGLKAAIESLGQTYGIPLQVEGDNEPLPLPEPVLSVIFRVVRELLFNIRKHALASHVLVAIKRSDDRLTIHVHDDGVGFEPGILPYTSPKGGYGLPSARAQILSLGGRLEIDSSPGAGTRIVIDLPLPDR